ncbi:hypothetical protein [Streptomyces sp. NPDC053079]|uniref:hypothetical protein n=1 Tax=Streptomyces sp. NPDC053079 TaxID=3365697 RepID=UPI0037D90A85
MAAFIRVTREELEEQRRRLLAESRLSYEELRDRAAVWTLSPEELDVWRTVRGIEYLLDG